MKIVEVTDGFCRNKQKDIAKIISKIGVKNCLEIEDIQAIKMLIELYESLDIEWINVHLEDVKKRYPNLFD